MVVLREALVVPEGAHTIALSIDGVLALIKGGNHPSEVRADAAAEGRLCKGPVGYREVGCATLAFCDEKGDLISALRFGRGPESKKLSLKQTLHKDLAHVLASRTEPERRKAARSKAPPPRATAQAGNVEIRGRLHDEARRAVRSTPMANQKKPAIGARKRPTQARAARLVEDILEGAARVLERHGARHFTTVRVAEEAGVSIGSLYQYFPNKEALLFRLQTDEWQETWQILDEILNDARLEPLDRLRKLVLVFFRSERQEAALRVALDDAGALFREAPEANAFMTMIKARMSRFFEEALPRVPAQKRDFAAELLLTSMSSLAEKVTARSLGREAVDAWAKASAEMYCAYIETIARPSR